MVIFPGLKKLRNSCNGQVGWSVAAGRPIFIGGPCGQTSRFHCDNALSITLGFRVRFNPRLKTTARNIGPYSFKRKKFP
ncbi:hypothetical protein C7400_104125 [Paraburkholderia tropica]|uniref:Uncharacterized protein n=1 Tax=Paraburkholderia tropica TaxID=92647 RepID=A0ABX5MSZ6_9BURK|nr:hypothetical protein C7400_104125 [Paraburkholderia tropica]